MAVDFDGMGELVVALLQRLDRAEGARWRDFKSQRRRAGAALTLDRVLQGGREIGE